MQAIIPTNSNSFSIKAAKAAFRQLEESSLF
jgi:hypothetical protein